MALLSWVFTCEQFLSTPAFSAPARPVRGEAVAPEEGPRRGSKLGSGVWHFHLLYNPLPFPLETVQSVSASSATVSRTLVTGQFLTLNLDPTTPQTEKFQAKAIS